MVGSRLRTVAEDEMVEHEVVRDGAGENGGGIGDLCGQAGVDEKRGDGEIHPKRDGFRNLISPVPAQPSHEGSGRAVARAYDWAIAECPPAVAEKVLERGQFERYGDGGKSRPVEVTGEKRESPDLGDKPAETDRVEDTPPPEIDPHINVCELSGKTGSRAEALAASLRGGLHR